LHSLPLHDALPIFIPIASMAEDIVFAVNIPPQAPAPGQAAHSTLCNAALSISPLLYCPTPSKADTASKSLPSNFPGNIVPPYTKTAGKLRRAIPIIHPGMFLSQPPIATTPSKFSALTTDSIESAMISRLGNEKRIPSVPMEIPSETVIVLKINGEPPDSLIPRLVARARPSMCILHG